MVHHIQANLAFGADRTDAELCELASSGPDWVTLQQLDGSIDRWEVGDTERLVDILGRSDLTCRGGRPVVGASVSKRLLAFAAGPPEVPQKVAILANILDLSRDVLPALDADQPEWWLIDATLAEGSA